MLKSSIILQAMFDVLGNCACLVVLKVELRVKVHGAWLTKENVIGCYYKFRLINLWEVMFS